MSKTDKRIMFKASAELGDGVSKCTYPDVESLCEAIRIYASEMTHLACEGETFEVELVAMSEEEHEQLPTL